MTKKTIPGNLVLTMAYDAVGNRTTFLDTDGGLFTYAFDAVNRVATVTEPEATVITLQYASAWSQATLEPGVLSGELAVLFPLGDEGGVQWLAPSPFGSERQLFAPRCQVRGVEPFTAEQSCDLPGSPAGFGLPEDPLLIIDRESASNRGGNHLRIGGRRDFGIGTAFGLATLDLSAL